MHLARVKLKNFRCYQQEIAIDVGDFTALMGRNDAGKSSVLDALAIFFGRSKADRDDASKGGDPEAMTITCEFDSLPDSLVLDATNETTLAKEHLLNADQRLEIVHVYNGTLKSPSKKVFLRANHPTNENASDLLSLKIADLRKRAVAVGASLEGVNQTVSAELREAIRVAVGELNLEERALPVSEEGTKIIWSKIESALPSFFLFGADRPSTDQDAEAQDPMKAAVEVAVASQRDALDAIASTVTEELHKLIDATVERITSMSPSIANGLNARINDELKWESVFKVTLHGVNGVPLNKRGSGVRRTVLLGFLQATAELKSAGSNIIYAIEEPETGQHPDMQRALLNAIRDISERQGFQVLLTTHTPTLGRLVSQESLRFIEVSAEGERTIAESGVATMRKVTEALGILPDHGVGAFVGVEGKHDINFLRIISRILSQTEADIPNLELWEEEGRVIFVPAGGTNGALWVSRLQGLGVHEFHIFDRDYAPPANPHYKDVADQHNEMPKVEAVHTSRKELENYLHLDAVREARPALNIDPVGQWESVPKACAKSIFLETADETIWDALDRGSQKSKANSAKSWLNTDAVERMTPARLSAVDAEDDIRTWLRRIASYVER
ncbi:ATP-binding protein [Curtobacterium caseinilyticum]|uniref:ATP-binding protein n=1 Tax=Curtobacterium caseinilyticum TaxID=3055137 RepID=A0ABT7TTY0_9MICO|nr:ATP-binding protein [Curtobacterium caseinilyticum]MDM7892980.1 ATP-binding protein [Curtobacterium caseinilyticum]